MCVRRNTSYSNLIEVPIITRMWNPKLRKEDYSSFFICECMGWRIICISQAERINYKLNSIGVMRNNEFVWINLDEIDTIIIECLQCNTSFKLLIELVKKGINLIICDETHLPIGSLNTFNNNQRTTKYNKKQIEWREENKKIIWTEIIKQKILLQAICLIKIGKKDKIDQIKSYIDDIENGDYTNREGIAAKVYFHELFGLDFVRKRNANDLINSSLNYVYQVIRSKIAQEIVSHGYIPSLGINHCSEYNYFCLADDFIEVYRPLLDYFIIKLIEESDDCFLTPQFKQKLINILFYDIKYDNSKHKLIESIKLYVINTIDAISLGKKEVLKFPLFYD